MKVVKSTSIRMDKDSTSKTKRTWTFDFEGVAEKVVAEIACRDLVIRLAKLHRDGKPIPKNNGVVMVADLVAGRALMSPKEMVAAGIASSSVDEKRAYIAQLSADVEAAEKAEKEEKKTDTK